MSRFSLRPLGIDIGRTRVRVACAEGDRTGRIRLRAVISRDFPDGSVASDGSIAEPNLVAALIAQARAELGVREQRVVTSLGAPAAVLHVMRFPRMTWIERIRAARFEAARFGPRELGAGDAVVRVHPTTARDWWSIGAARSDIVAGRVQILRRAHLRPVAIDHNAIALRRALVHSEVIADVGFEQTTLYAFDEHGPHMWRLDHGGADVTRLIASDLGIDYATAEKRKRILGIAGAGAMARLRLVDGLSSLIESARSRTSIVRVALTGNGVRLAGFAEQLEVACGVAVDIPVAQALQTTEYPSDVLRAAAPDWALAVGLALWSSAA